MVGTRLPIALRPPCLTGPQRDLLRRTVGARLTSSEFDQLLAIAERTGLDPLRRQLTVIARGEPETDGRSVMFITTIDGLRALAASDGDYRPMETAPRFSFSRLMKDASLNPAGLRRAEVKLWKRAGRSWHPVTGEAWWDEFAPLLRPAEAEGAARLPDAWQRMGRLMLAKCAEAQALRRGWPERLSGLYAEEESDRARVDATTVSRIGVGDDTTSRGADPSLVAGDTGSCPEQRLGGSALWLRFDVSDERVPRGQIRQRVLAHIERLARREDIEEFLNTNRDAWRAYWALDASDAHATKVGIEDRMALLEEAVGSRNLEQTSEPASAKNAHERI